MKGGIRSSDQSRAESEGSFEGRVKSFKDPYILGALRFHDLSICGIVNVLERFLYTRSLITTIVMLETADENF